MNTAELAGSIALLRSRASDAQWNIICENFRSAGQEKTYEHIISQLTAFINADSLYVLRLCAERVGSHIDPVEFAVLLETVNHLHRGNESECKPEIVWTGPSTTALPVRRTDQVLYDLIGKAREDILLVTFAAGYVERLKQNLRDATSRGVNIRLVLEFKEESQQQLSVDAFSAFEGLENVAQIYTWPFERRGVNRHGKPGKLHAKCAVVDESALVSSANLTDDAFNRNMELGLLFRGGSVPKQLRKHFDTLISEEILSLWHSEPRSRTKALSAPTPPAIPSLRIEPP